MLKRTSPLVTSVVFASIFAAMLSACNPSANTNQADSNAKNANNTPSQNDPACTNINQTFKAVTENSQIEDIRKLDALLETCLPTATPDDKHAWLLTYQSAWEKFLTVNPPYLTMQGEAVSEQYDLYNKALARLANGEALSEKDGSVVGDRGRYLASLLGKSEVQLIDDGEGEMRFAYDFAPSVQLFAKYLPEDEAAFITQRAKEAKEGPAWTLGVLMIEPKALMDRMLFWENFLRQYPSSYFADDVKLILQEERNMVFINQGCTDFERRNLNPELAEVITELAKRQDSMLGDDARTLLAFMHLSDEARMQAYPVATTHEDGTPLDIDAITSYQLDKALGSQSHWMKEESSRICFGYLVCINSQITEE